MDIHFDEEWKVCDLRNRRIEDLDKWLAPSVEIVSAHLDAKVFLKCHLGAPFV